MSDILTNTSHTHDSEGSDGTCRECAETRAWIAEDAFMERMFDALD